MSGNISKGKAKRLERKQEQQKIAALQKLIRDANEQENPLASFPVFQKFSKGDLTVNITCSRVTNLSKELIDWSFDLLKKNMQVLYEQSSWGWSDTKKKREMTEDSAWYLIATTPEGKPVAFSHFRFDMDFDDAVLYCYELHLEEECRRKGLGKFMLQILELMAFKAELRKVILTVFLHNKDALNFFRSMGYEHDETNVDDPDCDYLILSKRNKRLPSS
nr:EOG090X0MNC [Eulimnadia texana]